MLRSTIDYVINIKTESIIPFPACRHHRKREREYIHWYDKVDRVIGEYADVFSWSLKYTLYDHAWKHVVTMTQSRSRRQRDQRHVLSSVKPRKENACIMIGISFAFSEDMAWENGVAGDGGDEGGEDNGTLEKE